MVKFNIKVVILILLFLNLSNVFIENLEVKLGGTVTATVAYDETGDSSKSGDSGMTGIYGLGASTSHNSGMTASYGLGASMSATAGTEDDDGIANDSVMTISPSLGNLDVAYDAGNDAGNDAANVSSSAGTAMSASTALSAADNANIVFKAAMGSEESPPANAVDIGNYTIGNLTMSLTDTPKVDLGAPDVFYPTGNSKSWIELENISIGNPDNFTVSFDYKFTNEAKNWKDFNGWKTFIACTKTINRKQSDHFMIRGHGRSKNFGVWSGKGRQYTRTSKYRYPNGKRKLIDFDSIKEHKFTFTYSKEKGCEIFVDGEKWIEDRGSKIVSYAGWGNRETIFDDDNATYTWYVGGDYDKRYPFGKNHPIGVEISNIIITAVDNSTLF